MRLTSRAGARAGPPPLPPMPAFARRAAPFVGFAVGGLALCLLGGIWGYRAIAGLDWIDSFFNAAMILSGMGPVDPMPDDPSKIFAGVYAILVNVAWTALVGIVSYPFVHRMLHALHLQMRDDD